MKSLSHFHLLRVIVFRFARLSLPASYNFARYLISTESIRMSEDMKERQVDTLFAQSNVADARNSEDESLSPDVFNENSWRDFFYNELNETPTWRALWRKQSHKFRMSKNFKAMSERIGKECRLLHENWQRANFAKSEARQKVHFSSMTSMDDDFILVVPQSAYPRSEFRLLNRKNLVTKWKGRLIGENGKDWHIFHAQIYENIVIFGGEGMLRILNAHTKREIGQVKEPEGLNIVQLGFGHNGCLAAISAGKKPDSNYFLTVWEMKSCNKIVLKSRVDYRGRILGMNMDQKYITAAIVSHEQDNEDIELVELRFLSTQSLAVESCMKIPITDVVVASGRGLLVFVQVEGRVRVADIEAQKELCIFQCEPWSSIAEIRINSKYLLVASNEDDGVHFRVFDLEMARNPNVAPSSILLSKFKVANLRVSTLLMDETQLVCYGKFSKKRPIDDESTGSYVLVALDFSKNLGKRERLPKVKAAFSKMKRRMTLSQKKFALARK